MNIVTKCKQIRISAQKIRLLSNTIKKKKALVAINILTHMNKKSAVIMKKILIAAIANANHNFGLDTNTLQISQIFVDNGSTMKRIMPRAKGRTDRILKRTSHVTLILTSFLCIGGK